MAVKLVELAPITITATGVPESISASADFYVELTIQSDDDNSGEIRFGSSTVTTTRGPVLTAGNSAVLEAPRGPNGQAEEFVISDIFIVGTIGDVVELVGWRKR